MIWVQTRSRLEAEQREFEAPATPDRWHIESLMGTRCTQRLPQQYQSRTFTGSPACVRASSGMEVGMVTTEIPNAVKFAFRQINESAAAFRIAARNLEQLKAYTRSRRVAEIDFWSETVFSAQADSLDEAAGRLVEEFPGLSDSSGLIEDVEPVGGEPHADDTETND